MHSLCKKQRSSFGCQHSGGFVVQVSMVSDGAIWCLYTHMMHSLSRYCIRMAHIGSSSNPPQQVQSNLLNKLIWTLCRYLFSKTLCCPVCYPFLTQSPENLNNGVLPYDQQTLQMSHRTNMFCISMELITSMLDCNDMHLCLLIPQQMSNNKFN